MSNLLWEILAPYSGDFCLRHGRPQFSYLEEEKMLVRPLLLPQPEVPVRLMYKIFNTFPPMW